ncbi:class I SAM-dependent methyltransferase [Patescibacteria group bacterium]
MVGWAETIYDEDTKFTTPFPDEKYLSSLPKNVKILDVGCGYGRTLVYLNSLGFHNLTGFDISPSYIAQAKKNCPGANVYASSFENFSTDKKYDLILLMGIIEYIKKDKEQEEFFEKISQILSNKGQVMLETFVMDSNANWRQYIKGFVKNWHMGRFINSKGFECHHQTSRHLGKVLKKYFTIECDEKKEYYTWTKNICKGHYFVLRKK